MIWTGPTLVRAPNRARFVANRIFKLPRGAIGICRCVAACVAETPSFKANVGSMIAYVRGTRHPMPFSTRHGSMTTRSSVFAYTIAPEEIKDWRIVLDPDHYRFPEGHTAQ